MLPTKPYVCKLPDGKSYGSYSAAAICASVEIAGGGEVAAWPGFEEGLGAEIAKKAGYQWIGPGRWQYDPCFAKIDAMAQMLGFDLVGDWSEQ